MSSSTPGKHAGSGGARPSIPEPSFAERAQTLLYLRRVGSLSTLSRKRPGFPFGSVVPYALDDHANPIFLISTMAMHTQNLLADPRSSLLVTQPDAGGDPLGASRSHCWEMCYRSQKRTWLKHEDCIWRVMPTASSGSTIRTSPFIR